MAQTIAFSIFKGGTGKTTSTQYGAALRAGSRVLLVTWTSRRPDRTGVDPD
jgi:cellulose biosynthesis protein BcsQ